MSSALRMGIALGLASLIRAAPLGKRYLYRMLPVGDGDFSDVEPRTRMFFDRDLRYWVYADFGWSFSRQYYFYGRYPLDTLPLLIARWLSPGDVYVDIGAHWGVYALAGRRAVGAQGRVIAVEPNPASAAILEAEFTVNAVRNCTLHRAGLSDQPGELSLAMPDGTDSSWYTFRPLAQSAHSVKVPVWRADALLADLPREANILVKIDTEGYEHHVLRGFGDLLGLPRIAFVLEITDEWLRATGSSAQALFDDMAAAGFRAYALRRERSFLRRSVRLEPLSAPSPDYQYEVLFARALPAAFS